MSVSWQILTPLSSSEAAALERACDQAIDAYLSKHPDTDDAYGEVTASGIVPSEKEAAAAHAKLGISLPKVIRERLKKCRASLMIERPGDLDTDALQVSMLRFLLDHAGDALVLFNDYPLETSTQVLRDLSQKTGVDDFGTAPVAASKEEPAADEGLESRAERIIDTFEAAEDNVDLAIDLRDQLGRGSEPAQQYAVLLVREGPIDDAKAAKVLKLSGPDFERVAAELEALVAAVRSR